MANVKLESNQLMSLVKNMGHFSHLCYRNFSTLFSKKGLINFTIKRVKERNRSRATRSTIEIEIASSEVEVELVKVYWG